MKSLAVIVSGGSTTDLIQALTLVMAAVHEDMKTRVLFRDASVLRLTPAAVNRLELPEPYRADAEGVRRRLAKLDLVDLQKLVRDLKASGDVKYYVCSSSLEICGLTRADLIPEIDEVLGLPAFLKDEVAAADKVLTF